MKFAKTPKSTEKKNGLRNLQPNSLGYAGAICPVIRNMSLTFGLIVSQYCVMYRQRQIHRTLTSSEGVLCIQRLLAEAEAVPAALQL